MANMSKIIKLAKKKDFLKLQHLILGLTFENVSDMKFQVFDIINILKRI